MTWSDLWQSAGRQSRRAFWVSISSLLVAGVPVVGLLIALTAALVASRARRTDLDQAGDPQRLATISLLMAVLGLALGTVFTAGLLLLVAGG